MAIPLQRLEGKYEILEKLQEGGMGAIYKVRHRLLDEVRVIKVVRPQLQQDESLKTRFLAEARAATRLSHPNIAQIFDFAVDEDGVAYLVMELIRGRTLEELVQRGELPPLPLALEIARQSLRAIGHIHKHRIVHRDISPDNLMLTRDVDGAPLVKLIDLGVAKAIEASGGLTAAGVFVGKFRYAAPEQFDSSGDTDQRRGDLYSFGLVLYELLTGTFPILGDSPTSLIAGHLFRPPLPFTETDAQGRVPEAVRTVVLRALAKDPADRFADAAAFADALPKATRAELAAPAVEGLLEQTQKELPHPAAASSGSTQSRLDLHFGGPTPPPAPAGPRPVPEPEDTPGPAVAPSSHAAVPPEVEQAAQRVEGFIEDGELGAARAQLGRFEAAVAAHPRLAVLGERIDEIERIARRPVVRQLIAEAQRKVAEQSFSEALEDLERALALAPEEGQVRSLLEETQRAARQHEAELERRCRIAEHAEEVTALIDARQARQASEALRQAGGRYGRDARWAQLRGRLESLEAEQQATAIADLQELRHTLERWIEHGELARAESELERAREHWDDSELAELRRRLGEGRRRRQGREQADALVREAQELRQAGRLEEALDKARQAHKQMPRNKMYHLLVIELEQQAETRQEDPGRREARRAAEQEIRGLVDRGELDDAAQRLPAALEAVGPTLMLRSLQKQVEKDSDRRGAERRAERRGAKASRRERAEALVERARQRAQTEDFAEARDLLQEALRLAPEAPQALALRASVEACLEVREKEILRAAAVERTITDIRAHLARGETAAALRDLDQASARFGDHETLRQLRYQAAQARLEEAPEGTGAAVGSDATQLWSADTAAEEAAAKIEQLHRAGRSGQALELLQQTVERFGDREAFRRLRTELGRALLRRDASEESTGAAVAHSDTAAPEGGDEAFRTLPFIPPTDVAAASAAAASAAAAPAAPADPAPTPSLSETPIRSGKTAPLGAPGRSTPPGSHSSRTMLLAGAVVILLFVLLGLLLSRLRDTDPPDPLEAQDVSALQPGPTAVTIDAAPWGEIVRIVDADGAELAVPEPAFTPRPLTLPAGDYRVFLRHDAAQKPHELTVTATAGEPAHYRVVLRELTVGQVFADPPPQLAEATESFFAGDYAKTIEQTSDIGLERATDRARALLLRAAANHALFLASDGSRRSRRAAATADVQACRQADPSLEPAAEVFSPAFREFFAATR